jgi:hypothetical protein
LFFTRVINFLAIEWCCTQADNANVLFLFINRKSQILFSKQAHPYGIRQADSRDIFFPSRDCMARQMMTRQLFHCQTRQRSIVFYEASTSNYYGR